MDKAQKQKLEILGRKERLPVFTLSKQGVSKYKPKKTTNLIAIQDGDKKVLPFKERTNYITRDKYKNICWAFFDDVADWEAEKYNLAFSFERSDAIKIINHLDYWFSKENPEQIIVHCTAGASRSVAIAIFIAKYYCKDNKVVDELIALNKGYLGNDRVLRILEEVYKDKETNEFREII